MQRPNVNISVMSGGLNLQPPSEFGTSAVLVATPVAPVAGYGVAFLVKNKKQIATAFAQVGNEDVVTVLSAFYDEAPEGTKLYILAMAQATTMTTMLGAANADTLLNFGGGNIRLVGVIKFPSGAYVPTITTGFDDEVFTAVTAAQTLADAWFANKKPFRALIEGYAFDGVAATAKDYATDSKRNVGIVVGNIDGKTALATIIVLGRAARSEAQQNIGRIKTGSLKIGEALAVKIGATLVDDYDSDDLDTLWEKRYITFERNETGSGYVLNDDNMLTDPTDDYNNMRYGRVIDNATRIAFATYYNELKDDVDVDEDGRISTAVEKALETSIEVAIDQQIRGQLSKKKSGSADVVCLVNPDPIQYAALYENNGIADPNFNIFLTNNVYLFVMLKPKGCLKYISVYLGFTS